MNWVKYTLHTSHYTIKLNIKQKFGKQSLI
jgi:hypothetical protein